MPWVHPISALGTIGRSGAKRARRGDCYTDSEFAAVGDNFDGAVGYRVEGGKRYVTAKLGFEGEEPADFELWQDEDTDEPRIWHNEEVGEHYSGMPFTFKISTDPAKPEFVQETITKEGSVS